jgi:ATP-dependent DNA helicase DinG
VAWIENSDLGSGRRALVVAPLSVAGTLKNNLYEERTVVATSATLTLGGRFDTVARSLGLPAPAVPEPRTAAAPPVSGDGWSSLDVGSPFDYPKQGILYVAAHLPRPAASGLPDAAGEELLKLVGALGGRTLGLFSSRKAATQAAELLRARTGLPILLQGEESLPILVRKFREDKPSCLFGVMSLWQGVDVPGDACQLVVIDRLPFPRPDEPLAAARAAAVDASGGSGFASVSVPIAAVRLAQGVGRLIRSAGDKGVVAVLDSRLETARGYGAFLRQSLPPFWYTTRPEVAMGALQRLAKA